MIYRLFLFLIFLISVSTHAMELDVEKGEKLERKKTDLVTCLNTPENKDLFSAILESNKKKVATILDDVSSSIEEDTIIVARSLADKVEKNREHANNHWLSRDYFPFKSCATTVLCSTIFMINLFATQDAELGLQIPALAIPSVTGLYYLYQVATRDGERSKENAARGIWLSLYKYKHNETP